MSKQSFRLEIPQIKHTIHGDTLEDVLERSTFKFSKSEINNLKKALIVEKRSQHHLWLLGDNGNIFVEYNFYREDF